MPLNWQPWQRHEKTTSTTTSIDKSDDEVDDDDDDESGGDVGEDDGDEDEDTSEDEESREGNQTHQIENYSQSQSQAYEIVRGAQPKKIPAQIVLHHIQQTRITNR